jgi:hypothetical protein
LTTISAPLLPEPRTIMLLRVICEPELREEITAARTRPRPNPRPHRGPRQLAQPVEIYHSIIQRKLLDPNDFSDTVTLAKTLNDFEHHYNEIAQPFGGTSPEPKLAALLDRLDERDQTSPIALAA